MRDMRGTVVTTTVVCMSNADDARRRVLLRRLCSSGEDTHIETARLVIDLMAEPRYARSAAGLKPKRARPVTRRKG